MIEISLGEATITSILLLAAFVHVCGLLTVFPLGVLGSLMVGLKTIFPKKVPVELIQIYLKLGLLSGILYIVTFPLITEIPSITGESGQISPDPATFIPWDIFLGFLLLLTFLSLLVSNLSAVMNTKTLDRDVRSR